jgi:ubiquinone/menaquinone biosynthesis C-methylase UbiE
MIFLRKTKLDTEPLPIKMSGIRMGERLVQIGVDDPKLLAAMALKIGLSGSTSVVVADEAAATRARSGAAAAGALIDLHVSSLDALPLDNQAFDVAVVHSVGGLLQSLSQQARADRVLREAHRVLRHGGRVIAIEAGPKSGLAGIIRPYRPDAAYEAAGGAVAALQAGGFKPVRVLWEREGYRFTEGLKT